MNIVADRLEEDNTFFSSSLFFSYIEKLMEGLKFTHIKIKISRIALLFFLYNYSKKKKSQEKAELILKYNGPNQSFYVNIPFHYHTMLQFLPYYP